MWIPELLQAPSSPHSLRPEIGEQWQKPPQGNHSARQTRTIHGPRQRELLPHLTLSTVPSHPFPARGRGNRSRRQTSRPAPGRPPFPRPALLPPPLQRRALTATSRTRVRDCGKFQTACRALRKEEWAEHRERERAPDNRSAGGAVTHAGTESHHACSAPAQAGGRSAQAPRTGGRRAEPPRAQSACGCGARGEPRWAGPCPLRPALIRSPRSAARGSAADGLLELRAGLGDCGLWRPFSSGKARRRCEGAAPSSRPASPFLGRQRREGGCSL